MSRQKERTRYEVHTYEDGNTVRHLEAVPDFHEERRKRKEERRISEDKRRRRRAARRNRERALKMSAGYVTFLSGCGFAVALISAAYIYLQSDVTIRQKSIASLESEVSSLKIENDMTYKRITTAINLDEIKKKAKRLGMKYPTKKQIIYYTIDNSDFMTQYSE